MYKIFIVEDEHLEIEAIKIMINQHLDNVTIVGEASSGQIAIDKIRETQPDLILLDINIPVINGIEVLRVVKKENPDRKVILITAYDKFDFAHQAIKAHVDDFLLKPIRPTQLVAAINYALDNIKGNRKAEFDEKMQEVVYAVVQNNYSQIRTNLNDYLDSLYEYYQHDLNGIQLNIIKFVNELQVVGQDMCDISIANPYSPNSSNPKVLTNFQNKYLLRRNLMTIIDKIFDKMIQNKENQRNSMDDIINYIDRNCYHDISLDEVADFANMSSYYLSKMFKKETGINFVTYLTNKKIERAKDMLENTDVPIINIALELSYHEPNYFSKVFKKNTGKTPTEYRKQCRTSKQQLN
jgi:YesN/AraC family two-component response regulator